MIACNYIIADFVQRKRKSGVPVVFEGTSYSCKVEVDKPWGIVRILKVGTNGMSPPDVFFETGGAQNVTICNETVDVQGRVFVGADQNGDLITSSESNSVLLGRKRAIGLPALKLLQPRKITP